MTNSKLNNSNAKILLVEDDDKLASLVKNYLQQSGFDVRIEANGDNAIEQVFSFSPDLLILDIMLPGKDGLSICQEIRGDFPGPILMLTARNEDVDQVLGLEFGADDYVIKPTEPRVLLARIKALLRRGDYLKTHSPVVLEFGSLTIDTSSRQVTLEGDELLISSHEFEMLVAIASHAGEILSRDHLFNVLYNRPYDGLDRTIDVRISQLRKKLGDNTEEPFRIKTIWGKGYLFVADAW